MSILWMISEWMTFKQVAQDFLKKKCQIFFSNVYFSHVSGGVPKWACNFSASVFTPYFHIKKTRLSKKSSQQHGNCPQTTLTCFLELTLE